MGLTSEQFFRLTPRQYHALARRHKEAVKHAELLAGIIASATVNSSFCRPDLLKTPGDYMPSEWAERERREKSAQQKRDLIAQSIRDYFAPLIAKQQLNQKKSSCP